MPKKVIWAVDAFENKPGAYAHAAELLHALAKREAIELEAVYVLSPAQLNVSMEMSGPWLSQYRPAAEAALEYILKTHHLGTIARGHVLVQNHISNNQAVKTLLSYAEKNHCELIVTGTHARTGVDRVLMGSFAETLLHHSHVPVVVLGPGPHHKAATPSSLFSSILFPTEFGPRAKRIFRHVTRFAAEVGAKILLFHSVPAPIEPILQSGAYLLGGSWVPVSTYFSDEGDRAQRRANAWAKWARDKGVAVEVVIDSQGGSVADAILETAMKRHVGMIAIEAQSGPVASILIGSVTRQILRNSPLPVVIFRQAMRVPAEKPVQKAA